MAAEPAVKPVAPATKPAGTYKTASERQRYEKTDKAFAFLRNAEETKTNVSVAELATASGWSAKTAARYRTQRLSAHLRDDGKGRYRVEGIKRLQLDEFRQMLSQNVQVVRQERSTVLSERADALARKAKQAALLGVAIFNNPILPFRTEGFLVQMHIAWTALLHAVFERDGKAYTYPPRDGETPKSWDLGRSAKEYFADREAPVRENVRFSIELRNEIEHAFLPELDFAVAEHCQALLLNFEKIAVAEFGGQLGLEKYLAISLQCSTTASAERARAMKALQSQEYLAVAKFIDRFHGALPAGTRDAPEFRFKAFLIQVPANHMESADAAIRFIKIDESNPEQMKGLEGIAVLVKSQSVPVVHQGLLLPGAVAAEVHRRLGKPFRSSAEHVQAWKKYKVRSSATTGPDAAKTDARYCLWDDANKKHIYTPAWVEFLVTKLGDPAEYDALKSHRAAEAASIAKGPRKS